MRLTRPIDYSRTIYVLRVSLLRQCPSHAARTTHWIQVLSLLRLNGHPDIGSLDYRRVLRLNAKAWRPLYAIHDLLGIARLDLNRFEVPPTPLDLGQFHCHSITFLKVGHANHRIGSEADPLFWRLDALQDLTLEKFKNKS